MCYSDGLMEEDKRALVFKHANGMDEAIKMAFWSQEGRAKVCVLEWGEILPVVGTDIASNSKS